MAGEGAAAAGAAAAAVARPAQVSLARLGEKVAAARRAAGISMAELAARSGVAASTVHKVEAGVMVPGVAVLLKIAAGLGRPVSGFLDDSPATGCLQIVAARDRPLIRSPSHKIRIQRLAGPLPGSTLEAYLLVLAPGAHSGSEPFVHRGAEIANCLSGRIRFTVDGQDVMMGPGDTLHFRGGLAHRWRQVGRERARLVLIWSTGGAAGEGGRSSGPL